MVVAQCGAANPRPPHVRFIGEKLGVGGVTLFLTMWTNHTRMGVLLMCTLSPAVISFGGVSSPSAAALPGFAQEKSLRQSGVNLTENDMMQPKSYSEQLKDPRWQKRRLEIFDRDGWACVSCKRTDMELHVHHIRYIPHRAPWEYGKSLLQTLCGKCHTQIHRIHDAPGIVVCWTLEEIEQDECPTIFPWTGNINDRDPDSEIDPDYECIGKNGDTILINASCGRLIKKPDGLRGLAILDWAKQSLDEVNRSLQPST